MSGRHAFRCHFKNTSDIEMMKMWFVWVVIVLFVKHTDAVYSTVRHTGHSNLEKNINFSNKESGDQVMIDIERRLSSLESDNRHLMAENQQIHKTNMDLKQEMKQIRAENQVFQKSVRQLEIEYRHCKQDVQNVQEQFQLLVDGQDQHKFTASQLKGVSKNLTKSEDVSWNTHTEGQRSPFSVSNSANEPVISNIQQSKQNLLNDRDGIHNDPEKFNMDLTYLRNMLGRNGKNESEASVLMPRNVKRESRKNARVAVPTTAVAFHARLSTTLNNPGDNQPIIMSNVLTNEGSAYDKLSGHFTCQVPGVYVFFVTAVSFRDKNIEILLVKNGQDIGALVSGNSVYTGSSSNMVVVTAQTGDHFWLQVHDHFHDTGPVLDGYFSTFSGFLLH